MSTQTVILIRHGEALEESLGGDPYRELSENGYRQAADLGAELAPYLEGDVSAFVSPTYRAIQTWQGLAQSAGMDQAKLEDIEQRQEIYWGDSYEGLSIIRSASRDGATTVIVGHEPTISGLARVLAAPGQSVPDGMAPAEAVVLSSPLPWDEWGQGTATVDRVIQ